MDYGFTSNHAIIPANTVTQTARAFTGHEQIKEISGLIHSERLTNDNNLSFLVSNARVYDSDIGRFLSADTLIQDPHDSQSYNRYSYARNNPLVFTDPSGHSWFSKLWKKVKKYIRTIASIVVAAVIVIFAPGLLFAQGGAFMTATGTLTLAGSATIGALAGFASGAIMTGSLKGALTSALWGGIGAGLAFGIGHMIGLGGAGNLFQKGVNAGKLFIKSALHGLSRGIISMAQGGTFKSGFASGFSSSFFSPGTQVGGTGAGGFGLRTSIAAIVGGTASSLGGGKFSNGAVSGAFVHMFNAEYDTLGKALKGLWSKKGEIMSNIGTGFKGGLQGYREVRDNSPWYTQAMLKGSMTAIEMGLTGWIKDPVLSIWYNSTSGVLMDTYTLDPASILMSQVSQSLDYDSRWFKND